jgi:phosphatidate cytidylyltransferase
MSNLSLRVISGVILAAIVLGLTLAGGLLFRSLAIAIGAAILFEWCSITGVALDRVRTAILGAGFFSLSLLVMFDVGEAVIWIFFVAAISACVIADQLRRGAFWSSAGLFYAGFSTVSLDFLRADGRGLVTLLFLFAVVWATDIFAYFTGRAMGGPKLAPRISPGKTWSGAIGGAVCAMAAGTAIAAFSGSGYGASVAIVALILSVASQIGDLFESWVKRKFGRKDSSHIIPGHGGVMDRVDGLVIAAMALYVTINLWNQPAFLTGGG